MNPTEKQIQKEFNKKTRVIEWVSGCTYYIEFQPTLKSCCLDELYEMFKAYKLGLEIPKRTKFLIKDR